MRKTVIEALPAPSRTQIVKPTGELGMTSVKGLIRILDELMEQGIYRILLDLRDTPYVASSGIGVILAGAESARRHHGDLVLVGASPRVYHVFYLMGVDRLLRFVDTIEEGLAAMSRPA